MLSDEEGALAVRLARGTVEEALDSGPPRTPSLGLPPVFSTPRGVFVTWKSHPDGTLRGCVGYPRPVLPLADALRRSSVAAATDDPRFPPLDRRELDRVTVEVSVLSVPEELPLAARASSVVIGRDGLIVEGSGQSGLLLPQVAVEQGWTPARFLEGTCEKAGLSLSAWRSPSVRVLRFEAEVFVERSPAGAVERDPPPVTPARVRPGPRTSAPRRPSS